jgi:hypothetical protein
MLVQNNPELITVADLNENDLDFKDILESYGVITGVLADEKAVAVITVKTGSFKFNVNKTAADSSAVYQAGDKLMLTFINNKMNIKFKAMSLASGSATFTVEV